jgi:hypothetical protein
MSLRMSLSVFWTLITATTGSGPGTFSSSCSSSSEDSDSELKSDEEEAESKGGPKGLSSTPVFDGRATFSSS